MRSKSALFAGSFDPITLGHESIALRAAAIFDTLYVAIGDNINKNPLYSIEHRLEMLEKVFSEVDNIVVLSYTGLTVDFCVKNNISYLVRGLRTASDFDNEQLVANANLLLRPDLETLFLLTEPQHIGISSTAVRDILRNGGKVEAFIPDSIVDMV